MFTGAVPTPCVEQIIKTTPLADWPSVYVCCSGSFRVDQAVCAAVPGTAVHSNDVSLLSCAIGRLAEDSKLDLASIGVGAPDYQEINLVFLPADAERFRELLDTIAKKAARSETLAASVERFDRFFEAVVATKEKLGIVNTALAVSAMAELAIEHLNEMQESNANGGTREIQDSDDH